MRRFFVYYQQNKFGPFTWEELLNSNYPPDTLVWYESIPNWQPLYTITGQLNVNQGNQSNNQLNNEVKISSEFAHLGLRAAAYIIDLIIISPFNFLLLYLGGNIIFSIVLIWLYFALFESGIHQATPGKMVMGIKVVDNLNNRISFGQATGRYFGKILSILAFGIGFLMILWTDYKQGLHDKIADTYLVVSKERKVQN